MWFLAKANHTIVVSTGIHKRGYNHASGQYWYSQERLTMLLYSGQYWYSQERLPMLQWLVLVFTREATHAIVVSTGIHKHPQGSDSYILGWVIWGSSLIVPDFTISKYGSSCNSFFFGLILSSFLSLPLLGIPSCLGDVIKQKENTMERE